MDLSEEEIIEFRAESNEMLDTGEEYLLKVEGGEDFLTAYEAIFRVFHSLKGAASMVNLTELEEHMHRLENILVDCKNKKTVSRSQVTLFLRGIDSARELLDGKSISFEYNAEAEDDRTVKKPKKETAQKRTPLGSIAIIDDEEEVARNLAAILDDEGYDCTYHTSSPKFLSEFEPFKTDLIITDMRMPEVDGIGVIQNVRKKTSEIPVIFLSAFLSKEILAAAINHGVFAVIDKPFTRESLLFNCGNAVRKSRIIRLLNQSINFILYQFADLDNYLEERGKDDLRNSLKVELESIIEQRRRLRHFDKDSK